MNVLDRLLGKKARTTVAIAAEIARHEADRTGEQDRGAKACAALANVGLLSDAEHVQAEGEAAAAARAIVRIDARLVELRAAHAEAVKADERAALKAKAEAARRLVETAPKLLTRYEALAAELAGVAADLREIDREVSAANAAIVAARKADPDAEPPQPVEGVAKRFLTEPDVVTPDTMEQVEAWEAPDHKTGEFRPATVYGASGRPDDVAARKVTRERIIPGKTKPGRTLPSPTYGLVLPAARIGQEPFWPAR